MVYFFNMDSDSKDIPWRSRRGQVGKSVYTFLLIVTYCLQNKVQYKTTDCEAVLYMCSKHKYDFSTDAYLLHDVIRQAPEISIVYGPVMCSKYQWDSSNNRYFFIHGAFLVK